jgi:hypothetical protein
MYRQESVDKFDTFLSESTFPIITVRYLKVKMYIGSSMQSFIVEWML